MDENITSPHAPYTTVGLLPITASSLPCMIAYSNISEPQWYQRITNNYNEYIAENFKCQEC